MTTPNSPAVATHVIWGLVGIIAFAVGYFAADQPGASQAPVASANAPADSRTRTETNHDARDGSAFPGVPPEALTNDQAKVRAFEILALPNRIERTRKLCELLSSVNAGNWRGVIDACNIQTTREFRLNPGEFELLLTRVGEVAGAGAIAEALSSDKPRDRNNAPVLLAAWAASDGAAASDWFQTQPEELQKQFLKPFLAGVSQTDPKRALARVIAESQDVQEAIIPNIVDNAVQLRGFHGAEELLAPLLARADIEDGTKGKLFSKLAHRRIAVGQVTGDPFEALQWFDGYLDSTAPGPIATGQLFANAAARDPSATLAWLEERASRLNNFRGEIGYSTAAQSLAQRDAGKLSAWLDTNPDHPQHDRMIEAASGSLIQKGGLAEVQRLAQTVRDPQIRANLDGALKKAALRGAPDGGQ